MAMPKFFASSILRLGILFVSLTSLLLVPCAWTQTTMGAVSGTVRDQSGAVIPNAPITLTNSATNISQSTHTNEVGFYIFPDVSAGPYRLSAQFAGMQKFEGNLIVRVTERMVVDPVLQPGQTSTEVEVKDVTPLIATDHPTVSATLESERINQLPVNG